MRTLNQDLFGARVRVLDTRPMAQLALLALPARAAAAPVNVDPATRELATAHAARQGWTLETVEARPGIGCTVDVAIFRDGAGRRIERTDAQLRTAAEVGR